VLEYWFGAEKLDVTKLGPHMKLWFGSDPVVDAHIRTVFGDNIEHVTHNDELRAQLTQSSRGTLATIILLDQMPRNVYRGSSRAFAYDALALSVARHAVSTPGLLQALHPVERMFSLLPFVHSESLENQATAITAIGDLRAAVVASDAAAATFLEAALTSALQHQELIAEFGRFPHRNELLGRESTAAEVAYLAAPPASHSFATSQTKAPSSQ
jgi:uncharacterized protein (DUF924 family)